MDDFLVVRNNTFKFVFKCTRKSWDVWEEYVKSGRLTMLAEGLTEEQAKQFVELAKEKDDD